MVITAKMNRQTVKRFPHKKTARKKQYNTGLSFMKNLMAYRRIIALHLNIHHIITFNYIAGIFA